MESSSKFRSLNYINEYTTLDERQFMRSECKMNELSQEDEDALYRERIRSQYHLENESLIARAKTAEIRCRQIGTLHKLVVKDFKRKLEDQERKLQDQERLLQDKERELQDKQRELQELRAKFEVKKQLTDTKQHVHSTNEPNQQFESHDSLNDSSYDIDNELAKTKRMHKCISTPVLNSTKIQPIPSSKSNHEALKRRESHDSSNDYSHKPSSPLKLKDENDNEIANSKEKASKFFSFSNLRNLVKSAKDKNKKKFNEPTGKKPAKRLEYHPTNSGLKVFDSEDGLKHKQQHS